MSMFFGFNHFKVAYRAFHSSRLNKDFWSESQAIARQARPEHFIRVPETRKPYLKPIQKKFSLTSVGDYYKSDFAKKEGIFLYSNDWRYCFGWDDAARPLNAQKIDRSHNKIAIIIGNGNVFSWLKAFDAHDILLIDCEPVVHYFLLRVRSLILETNLAGNFLKIRQYLLHEIGDIESTIYCKNSACKFGLGLNNSAGIYTWLRDTHFLSSKECLEECQRALKWKELLPINVNVFDIEMVKALSEALKKANCRVSYMNLSNVADYDSQKKLFDALSQLPFDDPLQIISTSRIRNEVYTNTLPHFFLSQSVDELKKAIDRTYRLAIEPSYKYKYCKLTGRYL